MATEKAEVRHEDPKHEESRPKQHELTAKECFEEAAAELRKLQDETYALKRGYEGKVLAAEWRRLGQAVRGDIPKEYLATED